jgi:VanZ family protein
VRRIVAFLAWVIGASVSGGLLFGLIVMVSRIEDYAWLAFALAVGTALVMKCWPRMSAFVRWIIASFYALYYLTYQIGPWLHVGDRIGVNPTLRRLVDRFDRHFYAAQLLAMSLLAGLLIIRAFRDRKQPWFSAWLVLTLACGFLVVQYSGVEGAPGDFAARLASLLHISREAADFLVIAGRKTIHFTFYGLFALFAVKAGESAGADRKAAAWSGIGLALIHAVFDEARQSYSAGRSASILDVCLDAAGMAFFVYLLNRKAIKQTRADPNRS